MQQLETAFVTLFVYDPQGKPTWYYASDARIVAHVASGLPIFSGTLYRVEGPWHGGCLRSRPREALLHLDRGQGYLRVDDNLRRRCEYRGAYTQTGKLLKLSGAFTCSFGDALEGTFGLTDLESTQHGLSGYLRTFSVGLNEYGPFAAVRR